MREWTEILAAYRSLSADAKPCALATVVGVEGSAYRRPGARMLVAEDGRTWGGVSGGCLERDVADRARGVIAAGRPFLHRYDTSDEELIDRGVSTGCGGTIEVFIEPVRPGQMPQALTLLEKVLTDRITCHTAMTVRSSPQAGHRLGEAVNVASIAIDFGRRWQRLSIDNGAVDLFVERLEPPQRLVVVGGGPDAVPVVSMAKTLGWHVAVVAAKPALSLTSRFAAADERYVTAADRPLDGVPLAVTDAVVVMTHNIARDAAVLAEMTVRPMYLGLLGPRHRAERVLAPLPSGHPSRNLHAPVGLDIGSECPEEIALSIIAQIQSAIHSARPARRTTTVTCPT